MDIKEYMKKYYEKNKEKIKERSKKYYKDNKEKINERTKKYRENHREKIREYQKKYCDKNKEKKREYEKNYRKDNEEKIKEYRKEHPAYDYYRPTAYAPNHMKRYTDEEIALIRNMNLSNTEVAGKLHRSRKAIELKRQRLGLYQ